LPPLFLNGFVIPSFRFVLTSICALGISGAWVRAQTPGGSGSSSAPDPELAAFLAAQPKWSTRGAVETSYGYKDNLLLSAFEEERSAFARGSIEFLLLHLGQQQFDFTAFGTFDATHFFSGRTVNHEAGAWLQVEPGYRLGKTWNFTLPITGYYSDEVYDASDTEVERLVAEIKVGGVMIGPTARWTIHRSWWLEAQAVGERKNYEDSVNNGDVAEGIARLGWTRGRIEAKMTGTRRWRDFNSRRQYNRVGREIAGTDLKIAERAGEIRFDVTWDEAKHWQTATRASLLRYEDNGFGYFNYRERKIAQELEWKSPRWLVRISGSAARLDYGVQTVGFGSEPPARIRDEFSAELRIERSLTKTWKAVASYRWERGRSNDPIASYRVNEGLLGVRWSWDK
jgi:hypothetical protein